MALDDERFTPPHDGFFATDAFTDRAIEFVREAHERDEPFFLYLAYNAPHWPLQAPEEDVEKYRGVYDVAWQRIRRARLERMKRLGVVDSRVRMAAMDRGDVSPWSELTPAQRQEWARRMAIFAAQVSRMDANVGRLTSALDELGVADNTLVLFLSDNGGAPEDPHRGKPGAALGSRDSFWGYARPWATVSNTPWRRHKVTAYEGGISGPAIACWPAYIPREAHGDLVDGPAHLIDVLPTLVELAGARSPQLDGRPLEGRSLLDMIAGRDGPVDRSFCWEHEGNRAIRRGSWKLVTLASAGGGWELYDLAADRAESRNLAAERPELVRELAAEYDQWAARVGVAQWSEIEPRRPAADKPRVKRAAAAAPRTE
jgi:arylsulfatase